MEATTEINPAEIYVTLKEPIAGKMSLHELGIKEEDLRLNKGVLKLVIDLNGFHDFPFFKVPTFEFRYEQETSESHWQCDYNDHTILDRIDHHGRSTILLLKRSELTLFENRQDNKLVIIAKFKEPAHILGNKSFIHLYN